MMIRALITCALIGGAAACADQSPVTQDVTQETAPPVEEVVIEAEETAPIVDENAPAYVGLWGGDEASCALAPGSSEEAAIAITEGEYVGYDEFCRIGYAEQSEDGVWSLEMVCDAEGVEYTEIIKVASGEGTITITHSDDDVKTLTRCAGAF